jgi:hypothetical protein
MVVARVHGLDSSLTYRLSAQLLRVPPITVVVDGTTAYRLVPGTARGGLVLSAPRAAVGWSPPFAFPTSMATVKIHGGGVAAGHRVRIEFTSVPLMSAAG